MPLLPKAIVDSMMGGELGRRQVPDPAKRAEQLKRMLAARAGTDGASVKQVRLFLRDTREYGAKAFGLTGDALDEACFPMSAALAHELISAAHAAAPKAKAATGKKTKAGVLPIAAKCQLEAFAADPRTRGPVGADSRGRARRAVAR